jgi:hypothetical protein
MDRYTGAVRAKKVRHFIMHMRRAGGRSARPLNCSLGRTLLAPRGNPTRTDPNDRVLSAAQGAGESFAERGGRPSRCMQMPRRWGRAALRLGTERCAQLILFLLVVSFTGVDLASAQARRSLPKIGELWSGTESRLESYRQPYVKGMRALG